MNASLALQNGLLFGLFLSALMTVLVLGSLRLNNEMWLNDYPPDVRAKWGPMSPRAARLRLWTALPMFGLIIALLAVQVTQLVQRSGGDFYYWGVALSLWLSLMVFNLYDLLVLDWFFMLGVRPRWAMLPGTEGLAGYNDYAFHFHGFLKGTAGITIAAPVLAALAYGLYALLR